MFSKCQAARLARRVATRSGVTLIVLLTAWGAAAAEDPPVNRAEAELAVIEALGRGVPAAGAWSLLNGAVDPYDGNARPPGRVQSSPTDELRMAVSAARELASTGEAPGAATPLRLRGLLEHVVAADLLVEVRFDEIAARLEQLGLVRGEAGQRLRDARDQYRERSGDALETLRSALAFTGDGPTPAAVVQALDALSAAQSSPVPAVLRSTMLPYRPLSLAARRPQLEPAILPAYHDATDPVANLEDRAPSATAPLSTLITDQAAALDHDYVAIVEWVRNEIGLEWYAGSQQGAEGVLRSRRGNSVDRASLMVALLRASGAPTRFVSGVIELEMTQLQQDLGLPDASAVTAFLTRSGLAFEPVIRGGRVAAVHLEHVWVTAKLPYTNYRGAVVDTTGPTWVPIDASLLRHQVRPATDVLDRMGFDAETFRSAQLQELTSELPLDRLRRLVDAKLVEEGASATFGDQLRRVDVLAQRLGVVPSSLPYAVVAVTYQGAELPATLRPRMSFRITGDAASGSPLLLDQELFVDEVAGRRLTVSYQPATVDDHRLVLAFGGLDSVPAYLVAVRPKLSLAGRPMAIGEATPMASSQRLTMTLVGHWGELPIEHDLIAGSYLALAVAAAGGAAALDDGGDPADGEPLAARLLSRVAHRFADLWSATELELAALCDVALSRPLPAVVVVRNAVEVTTLGGVPADLDWRGVEIDAALRVAEGIGGRARDWQMLSALQGSALESFVLADEFRVEAISADRGLGLARQLGIPVVEIDATTLGGVLSSLELDAGIEAEIAGWVTAGYSVEVPVREVELRAWKGAVWRVEAPATGAAGYFLAGRIAGGSTVTLPDGWTAPLAGALASPYTATPNEDPLSAASIEIIASTDRQRGVVDTFLPRALGVRVEDEDGRPVAGAAVTFFSHLGGGTFATPGNGAATVVTVRTDRTGVASVPFKAGKFTRDRPVFLYREPDDENVSQALEHHVLASVATRTGPLELERTLEAVAFPGPVARFERLDDPDAVNATLEIAGIHIADYWAWYPGLWSKTMDFVVEDAFGNPVANDLLTVFSGPVATDPFQNMVAHDGVVVSCDIAAENPNASYFEATTDSEGRYYGCSAAMPQIGQCGKVFDVFRSLTNGHFYIGVIPGDSIVGYLTRVRRDRPESDLACAADIEVGNATTDPDQVCPAAAPDSFALEYYFAPLVGSVPFTHPDINPCHLRAEKIAHVEGIAGNAATAVGDLLPTPASGLTMRVYGQELSECRAEAFLCTSCVADEPPVCQQRTSPFCKCDNCDLPCDERWAMASHPQWEIWDAATLDVRRVSDYARPEPYCVFNAFCDRARWQMSPRMLFPDYLTATGSTTPDGYRSRLYMSSRASGGTLLQGTQLEPYGHRVLMSAGSEPGVNQLKGQLETSDMASVVGPDSIVHRAAYFEDDGLSRQVFPKNHWDSDCFLHEDGSRGPCPESEHMVWAEFAALDIRTLSLQPAIVRVGSESSRSLEDLVVLFSVRPFEYLATSIEAWIIRRWDGARVARATSPARSAVGALVIPRYQELDVDEEYELVIVVNPGNLYEVRSPPVALELELAGSIIRNHWAGSVADATPFLAVSRHVDLVRGDSCDLPSGYVFQLLQDADVRLVARRIENTDTAGNPSYSSPIELLSGRFESRQGAELRTHFSPITPAMLPPGDYLLELRATVDGETEVQQSRAISSVTHLDSLALGHTLHRGVDLWDGGLNLTREDFALPGLGAGLELRRSYSSADGTAEGTFGIGWSHNYDSQVTINPCGVVVVSGGMGSGMKFRYPEETPPGTGPLELVPLNGYNGTLLAHRDTNHFEYISVGGYSHRYGPSGRDGSWRLERIAGPNPGGAVELRYLPSSTGMSLSTVIEEGTGRQLDFVTEERRFLTWSGPVITKVQGPGDLELELEYDEHGHLVRASRANGLHDERYAYERQPDWDFSMRHVLSATTDALSGATSSYTWQRLPRATGQGTTISTLAVSALLEAESTTPILFDYDEAGLSAFGGSATTVVTDRRGFDWTYHFNRYGGVIEQLDPLGNRTTTAWNELEAQVRSRTDENGVTTSYTYDDHGNLVSETVDGLVVTQTFHPPGSFSAAPHIKDRPASRTDRAGGVVRMDYDANGNLVRETHEVGDGTEISTEQVWNGGRPVLRRDGRGNVTQLTWDGFGNLLSERNALLETTKYSYDVRGRRVLQIDARQNARSFTYDERDRLVERRWVVGPADRVTYAFDDAALTQSERDAEGRVTTTYFDKEGRILRIQNAAGGTKLFEYDAEGNKVLETAWFDEQTARVETSFTYDQAGRLVQRDEPLGRRTLFEYDPAGNLLRETLVDRSDPSGFEPRATTIGDYDELNRPRRIARRLVDPSSGGERELATIVTYDGEGRKIEQVDPVGNVATWQYDGLGRVVRESLGNGRRVTSSKYDANSNLIETILDNDGQEQRRTQLFDAANRVVQKVDAEGNATFLTYDMVGNLIKTVDPRGSVTQHEYDTSSRRKRMLVRLERGRPSGIWAETKYDYDLVGNLIWEKRPNGNVILTELDALNRPTGASDALGGLGTKTYDARGNVLTSTDPGGHTTVEVHDALDRVVSIEMPEGRTITKQYNVAGEAVAESSPRGAEFRSVFDTLGRQVETIAPSPFGYRQSFSYDDNGNLLAHTDARGLTTDYTYDALDRRLTEVAPEQDGVRLVTTMAYDAAGNEVEVVDRRGVATTSVYDKENRLLQRSRAGVLLEAREYDAAGLLRFATDANGNATGFEYDERGAVLVENRPESATLRYNYDVGGNLVETSDPLNHKVTYSYDVRNQRLSERREVTPGIFAVQGSEYDADGLVVAEVRPLGGRFERSYDDAHRLASVVGPASGTTTYTYDASDNLLSILDAEGQLTELGYDELERRVLRRLADGTQEHWSYDEEGNQIGSIDGNGRATNLEYDALGRLVRATYPPAPELDLPDPMVTIESRYDANGNVTLVTEGHQSGAEYSTTQTFDLFDRLESVTDRFGKTIRYSYDANGNRTQLAAPGQLTSYRYDGLNRAVAVTSAAGVTNYRYFANGTLRRVEHPNGSTATHTYDLGDRLVDLVNQQGSTVVSRYTYELDRNGNRLRQTEAQIGRPSEVTTYTYDPADRLLEVRYPDRTVDYTYDLVGNRLSEEARPPDGGPGERKTYTYSIRHELERVSVAGEPERTVEYTYDANGNRIRRAQGSEVTNLVYDTRDQLTVVDEAGSPIATYGYDYKGLRISKLTDAAATYLYDGASVLQHTDPAGTTLFDYGPDRLASASHPTEGRSFYLFDGLGSVADLTSTGGFVRVQYGYDAWGNRRFTVGGSDGNLFGFTGHEMDGESGLIYAKARFYDPETGIFLSEDPVEGEATNGPSLHRYLYAYQNPTVWVDPDGRTSLLSGIRDWLSERGDHVLGFVDQDSTDWETLAAGFSAGALRFTASMVGLVNFGVNQGMYMSDTKVGEEARLETENSMMVADQAWNGLVKDLEKDFGAFLTSIEDAPEKLLRAAAIKLLSAHEGDRRDQAEIASTATEILYSLIPVGPGSGSVGVVKAGASGARTLGASAARGAGRRASLELVEDIAKPLAVKESSSGIGAAAVASPAEVRFTMPGDFDFIGPLRGSNPKRMTNPWKVAPDGDGAHLLERAPIGDRPQMKAVFDQNGTPRFYPYGSVHNAGVAHARMHEATKAAGIELKLGANGMLSDAELIARYRTAYANDSLEGIRGDLRTPNGSVVVAKDVTPLEAMELLLEWGGWK